MYGSVPYMMPNMAYPAATGVAGTGALKGISSLFSKINFSSILTNTQKTLSVVNQAIPLYYQVKPVFKNIRAIGKIGKEFSKIGQSNNQSNESTNANINNIPNNVSYGNTPKDESVPEPNFFI